MLMNQLQLGTAEFGDSPILPISKYVYQFQSKQFKSLFPSTTSPRCDKLRINISTVRTDRFHRHNENRNK